jgi:hypothetical protein
MALPSKQGSAMSYNTKVRGENISADELASHNHIHRESVHESARASEMRLENRFPLGVLMLVAQMVDWRETLVHHLSRRHDEQVLREREEQVSQHLKLHGLHTTTRALFWNSLTEASLGTTLVKYIFYVDTHTLPAAHVHAVLICRRC